MRPYHLSPRQPRFAINIVFCLDYERVRSLYGDVVGAVGVATCLLLRSVSTGYACALRMAYVFVRVSALCL